MLSLITFNTAILLFIIGAVIERVVTLPAQSNQHSRSTSLSGCLENSETAPRCEAYLPSAKAAQILAFMKPDVDPCQDFYEFACGNFPVVNKALTKPTTGFFETLTQALSRKIAEVLNSTAQINETEYDRKVKRFYKSCMKLLDVPLEEHKSSYKKIIAEFGSMPALEDSSWNANNFNWLETLGKIQYKYDIQPIIGAAIMADFKENSKNRIYFGQSEFPLESKSMYVDANTAKYRNLYIKKISYQLRKYLKIKEEKAYDVARKIVAFEQSLAKGMLDDNIARDMNETCKLITPMEMSKKYAPFLNVSRFLELCLGEPIKDSIYDCNEDFQYNLKEVISSVPKETVANYIFYQLVSEFFPKVEANEKSQHKECVEVVKGHFSKLLDNMIYRRYKQEGTENDINAVWRKIKDAFDRELNSPKLSWISPKVREKARKKLNSMKLEINSYMDTNFTEELKDLVITNAFFIENVQNIHQNNAKIMIKKLHETPTPYDAGADLSYTPVNIIFENKIKIPVSLLQPYYLWNKAYPEALMYGTLGFLIGHELIHGFDDNGRNYDEIGNENEWWDEESELDFIQRTECFIEQYHKYVFGGAKLPRSESQAENIADNGGLRIAYDAYLNWLEKNEDRILPHLEKYTSKQLFFISFAQVWCSDTLPSIRDLQTATDEHTPGKFRVIGVLSNNDEFAKEFKCALGSKMSPINKCIIY